MTPLEIKLTDAFRADAKLGVPPRQLGASTQLLCDRALAAVPGYVDASVNRDLRTRSRAQLPLQPIRWPPSSRLKQS